MRKQRLYPLCMLITALCLGCLAYGWASASGSSPELQMYRDPNGGFTINLPKGWSEKKVEGLRLTVYKDKVSIGIVELSKDKSPIAPLEFLTRLLDQMRDDSETYPDFRVSLTPSLESGEHIAISHARGTLKSTDGGRTVCELFVLGDSDSRSRFIIMSRLPAEQLDDYRTVLDTIAHSMAFGAQSTDEVNRPALLEIEHAKSESTFQGKTEETVKEPIVQRTEPAVPASRPAALEPLYWIRNRSQIMRDGRAILSDNEIGEACVSPNGKLIAYSRGNSDVMLLNLSTGKRTAVCSRASKIILPGTDAASPTAVYPVGFSADSKRIYIIYQVHSVFVGGNKLLSVGLSGGKAAAEDTGVASAAVSRGGDLLIQKPGTVTFIGKSGSTWEYEPSVRSIFLLGVGFTCEGKPFYYTSDDVRLIDPKGSETTISLDSNLGSRPVVIGDTVVWDNGKQLRKTKGGATEKIVQQGTNTNPFK